MSNTLLRENIRRIAVSYVTQISLLIGAMTGLAFGLVLILDLNHVMHPLIFSAVYSIIISLSYIFLWQKTAILSIKSLGKFYMASSVLRMLLALTVVFITVVLFRDQKTFILSFIAVFMSYYVMLLVFDTVYFSNAERKNKLIEQ